MARPSRHVLVLTLLAVVLSLTGCGSDPGTETAKVGEIVYAKSGVDTTGAPKTHLLLPSGRLDVRAGAPIDALTGDATHERTARDAPGGGVFVPITWTFRTAEMARLVPVFGRPLPIEMTLISGGERYTLSPPVVERDGEDVDAYYVAVGGTGQQLDLEVTYAGVTQMLDLVSGDRSKGQADGLYSMDTSGYSITPRPCPSDGWIDEGPAVQVTFSCTSTKPLVVPFVDGKWAPKDHSFVLIGLDTSLSFYQIHGTSGSGATYTVSANKDKTELAGKRPAQVLEKVEQAGIAGGYLVFDLLGKLPKDLSFHRTYQLQRSALQGDVDAPDEVTLDIEGTLPLKK
ncbi:MAG: hypothetical protein M3237_15380 [Actinomycetota bacterium]|nr:hypothetical protein [Actinomycetota bacterium]